MHHRKILFLILTAFIFFAEGVYSGSASAAYVPFTLDDAVPILLQIIKKKTLPVSMHKKGIRIIIKDVKQFNMNWDKSEFNIVFSFTIAYSRFLSIEKYGEISVSGVPLIAPDDGMIGIKLTGISNLNIEDIPDSIEIPAEAILNKSLVGMEYWTSKPSSKSIILTRNNFSELLRIVISQKLPFTARNGGSNITFYELIYLSSYRPGKVFASFYVKGLRSGLVDLEYEGVVSSDLELCLDPETLEGYIKIVKISKLKLENRSSIMQEIIKMLTSSKMEGKVIKFKLSKR